MGLEKGGRSAPQPHPELDDLRKVKKELEDGLVSEFLRFEDLSGFNITRVVVNRVGTSSGRSTIASIDVSIEL
jgi:hypothetical protein